MKVSPNLIANRRAYEERLCHVGTPNGPTGTVEKVYQARGKLDGVYRCKVIMDSGSVRYEDIADVYIY